MSEWNNSAATARDPWRGAARILLWMVVGPPLALMLIVSALGTAMGASPLWLFNALLAQVPTPKEAFSDGTCGTFLRDNCVIDGNTVMYRGKRTQLSLVDAPRIEGAACPAEQAAGAMAAHTLARSVIHGKFYPLENAPSDPRDPSGSHTAALMVNGTLMRTQLETSGLSQEWSGAPTDWCSGLIEVDDPAAVIAKPENYWTRKVDGRTSITETPRAITLRQIRATPEERKAQARRDEESMRAAGYVKDSDGRWRLQL